jgi:hypothetical protein
MVKGKTDCKGCIEASNTKCKIFLQSVAFMETLLYNRQCCFKKEKDA